MFCGKVVKKFSEGFLLVQLCAVTDCVLVKCNGDSIGEHIILRNIKKCRVSLNNYELASAVEADVRNTIECHASSCKLASSKYFLDIQNLDNLPDLLMDFILQLKGFVIGELKSSKHTNLYHLYLNCGKIVNVIMTDSSLLLCRSLIGLSSKTCITKHSYGLYYYISAKSDFIILSNKHQRAFKPFRIVPPSQQIQVSELFGRRTGDHLIAAFVVGEYLGHHQANDDRHIVLGDLKGIASIPLIGNFNELMILPSEGNGYTRTRVFVRNAILRVDDLGIHRLYYAPETTSDCYLHLEYWPATEYTLQIPFEWFSPYYCYSQPCHQNSDLKRIIKFQFLPFRQNADYLYCGIDRKGTEAMLHCVDPLELGKWYLGVGQVIRLPSQSHDGTLGILLTKHRPASPLKDRKVLLQLFSPILSHIDLSNAYN